MTINSTTRKTNPFTGNGSAHTFPFTFKVFTDADIVVKKLEASTSIETTLTLGVNNDYIVTLNADQNSNPGGSITLKSGGNNSNLASGFSIVITSAVQSLQGTDLTNQGGFFPEVINDALDKSAILHQQQQTELDRSIRFSLTNTIGSLEITENANARKNRVLGFDNLGEFEVLKELGTYRGNWSASTAYAVRDLVKDTSTNNIFFCNTAHTSSGSQPLTTNTNSANWDLIVDAATATTSSNNAASSATAAANSATAAANSATAAGSSQTAAASSQSAAASSASTASTQASAASTSASAAQTAQTAAETALDSFDDRYLGAKANNPTVDNDGNALIDGALYFNTTVNRMRVYDLGNTTWLEVTISGSDLTNTNTVAGAITNVNNVGGSIANVNAVGGAIAAVNTVAGEINNNKLQTVANNINAVVTAADDLNEATSEIDTVANAITNVNNVGNSISNVNTVAGISSQITAVAADATDIGLVAGSITNVNNVGGSIANVNTVASNLSGVNSFAERYRTDNTGNNPSTSLNAGDLFYNQASGKLLVYNGQTSAWEETQSVGNFFINTISSFSGTGGNSATFNGSAYKFTLSNAGQFAQQMLVSINGVVQKPNTGTGQPSEGFALDGANIIFSSAPPSGADFFIVTIGASVSIGTPSDGTVTEAKLNVSNNPVNGYFLQAQSGAAGGLTWAQVTTDLVGDTSPQLGGALDTNGNNITFGDSGSGSDDRLTFGASQDLQIYHDGNHSRISDQGTGYLVLETSQLQVNNAAGNQTLLIATESSSVRLYHANEKKLETGTNGISVFDDTSASVYVSLSANSTTQGHLYGTANTLGLLDNQQHYMVKGIKDGAVELYHNNSKKIETTANGFNTQGSGQVEFIIGSTDAGGAVLYLDGDSDGDASGGANYAYIYHNTAGALLIRNRVDNAIHLGTNDTERWYVYNTGHFVPAANNTYDIGTSSVRVRNIYTNDLNLSNEGGANDVDGTWGSFTIQEGADDLFLINKRTKKKYKFNLTEVN